MNGIPFKSLLMSGLMMCRSQWNRNRISTISKYNKNTRWNNETFRFFYVRYASGLIKEGLTLLHKLTLILVTTFIIWHFFMWQGRAWFYGSAFRESIKGKICMKANLTAVHDGDYHYHYHHYHNHYHLGETIIWKPKLIMISCNIILWLFLRDGLWSEIGSISKSQPRYKRAF